MKKNIVIFLCFFSFLFCACATTKTAPIVSIESGSKAEAVKEPEPEKPQPLNEYLRDLQVAGFKNRNVRIFRDGEAAPEMTEGQVSLRCFFATRWCDPCKDSAKIVAEVAPTTPGVYYFIADDAIAPNFIKRENPEISTFPRFYLYEGDKKVAEKSGRIKDAEELMEFLAKAKDPEAKGSPIPFTPPVVEIVEPPLNEHLQKLQTLRDEGAKNIFLLRDDAADITAFLKKGRRVMYAYLDTEWCRDSVILANLIAEVASTPKCKKVDFVIIDKNLVPKLMGDKGCPTSELYVGRTFVADTGKRWDYEAIMTTEALLKFLAKKAKK